VEQPSIVVPNHEPTAKVNKPNRSVMSTVHCHQQE
jgi:hypothetical protein